jgi:hypothetical protein
MSLAIQFLGNVELPKLPARHKVPKIAVEVVEA